MTSTAPLRTHDSRACSHCGHTPWTRRQWLNDRHRFYRECAEASPFGRLSLPLYVVLWWALFPVLSWQGKRCWVCMKPCQNGKTGLT